MDVIISNIWYKYKSQKYRNQLQKGCMCILYCTVLFTDVTLLQYTSSEIYFTVLYCTVLYYPVL